MRKVVLIKNALHDRSALQSPIGPMPRSNLTPPCPILMDADHKRSQTPPPPSHSRLRQETTIAAITPPSVSRRLPRSSLPRAVHQPVRFNSPPPTSVFSGIQCPHPRPPVFVSSSFAPTQTTTCHVEAGPTPPMRSKCPCCC